MAALCSSMQKWNASQPRHRRQWMSPTAMTHALLPALLRHHDHTAPPTPLPRGISTTQPHALLPALLRHCPHRVLQTCLVMNACLLTCLAGYKQNSSFPPGLEDVGGCAGPVLTFTITTTTISARILLSLPSLSSTMLIRSVILPRLRKA